MIRHALVLIALLVPWFITAQNLEIKSFELSRDENIAMTNARYDLNNDLTSVVIIEGIPDDGVEIHDGSVIDCIKTSESVCTLYILDRTKKITVYSPGFLPLEVRFDSYEFTKSGVIGGTTYKLVLSKPKKKKEYGAGSKMVIFRSNEPISRLVVDGNEWDIPEENPVMLKRLMPYGEYDYKITSISGKMKEGIVEVDNSFGSKTVNINF